MRFRQEYRPVLQTSAGYCDFVDGSRRRVYVDTHGRFVLGDEGERVYGLWLPPQPRPDLHRDCDEFGFRWERRKIADGERTVDAIAITNKFLDSRKPQCDKFLAWLRRLLGIGSTRC